MSNEARLIPVKAWPKFYPWPSVAGRRNLIVKADKNGFDTVIIRIGRRVLIDEQRFLDWARAGVKAGPRTQEVGK